MLIWRKLASTVTIVIISRLNSSHELASWALANGDLSPSSLEPHLPPRIDACACIYRNYNRLNIFAMPSVSQCLHTKVTAQMPNCLGITLPLFLVSQIRNPCDDSSVSQPRAESNWPIIRVDRTSLGHDMVPHGVVV